MSGWKAPVADLKGDGARFATIDYSETPPHIYIGEKLPFDQFHFSGCAIPSRSASPRAAHSPSSAAAAARRSSRASPPPRSWPAARAER
jgi:hypothetical protein